MFSLACKKTHLRWERYARNSNSEKDKEKEKLLMENGGGGEILSLGLIGRVK